MKKYIYSPHHIGLVLAPLMTDPTFGHYPDYESFEQDFDTYNSWLSSPPIYKVRPEDIEWFSVERGEDEFEVRKQWLREKANQWLDVDMHLPINYYCKTRIVAIPKKGNESTERKIALSDPSNSACLKFLNGGGKECKTLCEGCFQFYKMNLGNESKEQSPSVEQGYSEAFWTELRDRFFKECTDRSEHYPEFGDIPKVNMTPHNIFEWFKSSLIHQPYK
jgi:hypothetical protein